MAYVSNVTHQKLVGKYTTWSPSKELDVSGRPRLPRTPNRLVRGQSPPQEYTPEEVQPPPPDAPPEPIFRDPVEIGIRNCGFFPAALRCAEPDGRDVSTFTKMAVWTGESDGKLCLRQGWSGSTIFSLGKQRGAFVTALLSLDRLVYVGLSDGFLCVYEWDPDRTGEGEGEVGEYSMVAQVKKHTGGITCMVNDKEVVITGGLDWQIFIWEFRNGTLCVADQFIAHQLAVRCLAFENGRLFSGGDEGVLRCLDLRRGSPTQGKELITAGQAYPGFPITQHKGGVRALTVINGYLFSAAQDGYIKVWSAEKGDHIRTLMRSEGAVLTLMKDVPRGCVWSGGVDGVIRVWDATQDFDLICELADHRGSFVTDLRPLCQVYATRVWTVTNHGELKIWYHESDVREPTDLLAKNEEMLTNEIERLRGGLLSDYEELEKKKMVLKRLQVMDQVRKERLVRSLGAASQQSLKKSYYMKLMLWIHGVRAREKRNAICDAMAWNSMMGKLHVCYCRLKVHAERAVEQRRKELVADHLMGMRDQGLQVLYWRKLKEYMRRTEAAAKREAIATALMSTTRKGTLRAAYGRWSRWVARKRQASKRRDVSHALLKQTKKGVLTVYYYKLLTFATKERDTQKKESLANALNRNMVKGILQSHYYKWLRWTRRKRDCKKKGTLAELMSRNTTDGIRRVYYSKWFRWRVKALERALESQYKRLQEKILEMEEAMKAAKYLSEEEILRQVDAIEEDVARMEREIAEMEEKIGKLEATHQGLLAEAQMQLKVDRSMSLKDQLLVVCQFLKAKSVSCNYDLKAINDAFESRRNPGPDVLLSNGVARLQRALRDLIPKDTVNWGIDTEGLKKLDPRCVREAHRGIKEIVISIDQLKNHPDGVIPEDAALIVVANANTLFEVVAITHGDRMEGEEVALRAFKKTQEANPYARYHGKLIHDPNSPDAPKPDTVPRTKREVEEQKTHSRRRAASPNTPPPPTQQTDSMKRRFAPSPPTSSAATTSHASRSHTPETAKATKRDATPPIRAPVRPGTSSTRAPVASRVDPAKKDKGPTSTAKAAARSATPGGGQKKANPGFKVGEDMMVQSVTSCPSIQAGDVVLTIDDRECRTKAAYVARIKATSPGDVVMVGIQRGKEVKVVKVTMGEM